MKYILFYSESKGDWSGLSGNSIGQSWSTAKVARFDSNLFPANNDFGHESSRKVNSAMSISSKSSLAGNSNNLFGNSSSAKSWNANSVNGQQFPTFSNSSLMGNFQG